MLADALPETTQFIDTRYPPIPAIISDEPVALSDANPALPEDAVDSVAVPAPSTEAAPLYQPYECSQPELEPFMVELLTGLCQ